MKMLSCCYVLCSHLFLHALSSLPHLSILFEGFYLYLHGSAWGCGVLFSSSFGRAGSWGVLNLELRVSELNRSWLTSGCLERKARSGCRGSNRRWNLHPDLNARSAFQRDWADFVCIKGTGSAQHPLIWGEDTDAKDKTKAKSNHPPNLCPETVTVAAGVAGPTSCPLGSRLSVSCPRYTSRSMRTDLRSVPNRAALYSWHFYDELPHAELVTPICLLLPPACPSPSLVKGLSLSSAFCFLQLCRSSFEATPRRICAMVPEAPLQVCPFAP